jgi:hypothetical protein
MSLELTIRQMPLAVTPTHSDHTWNVVLNDYSAYTDIRLVVDIYANPYQNDSGSTQDYGKVARLLVPSNEYGNCIFNVETIIYNLCNGNPRNMGGYSGPSISAQTMNPYNVLYANSQTTVATGQTSQSFIGNQLSSTISFSNGFNGGYEGFDNIYHINEYRCVFGIQYTNTGGTTTVTVPINYSAYTGYTGGSFSITSAAGQPYGVMIYPGVQENKRLSTKYYYSGINLTGQYNYLNSQVYDYQMSTGNTGYFMSTFGTETIPMTILGSLPYQTRYRTHYYKCPIVIGFMYGGNPLFNNTNSVEAIVYLQKTLTNNQSNYDVVQTNPIGYTARANAQANAPYSFLQQRIAYGIFKQNPNLRTDSDVAIFLSNRVTGIDYDVNGASEIVQYKMVGEECFNDPVSFLFLNRQGIWDTYTFTKKFTKKYDVNKKVYNQQKTLNTKWWNRQSIDSSETTFYGEADEMVTVASNFVIQNDVEIIEQLLMSPYVYMIMDNWLPATNMDEIYPYLIPCTVQNKEVKQYINKYERIFQYEIELKQVPYRPFYIPF